MLAIFFQVKFKSIGAKPHVRPYNSVDYLRLLVPFFLTPQVHLMHWRGHTHGEDFTLPHIFQLDSTWSLAESIWSPGVHPPFFLWWHPAKYQSGVHLESAWSPAALQVDSSGQNGLHLRTQGTVD